MVWHMASSFCILSSSFSDPRVSTRGIASITFILKNSKKIQFHYENKYPGPCFNIDLPCYQYRNPHCKDKMILWPSYLHNSISYTGKTSLYWIRDHVSEGESEQKKVQQSYLVYLWDVLRVLAHISWGKIDGQSIIQLDYMVDVISSHVYI